MRLRRPAEFRHVWDAGRSWAHPLLILRAVPNTLATVRVGITASRKVGDAVTRNRARRLLREAARQLYPHIVPGWDLVLVARASMAEVKTPAVAAALTLLLQRAHLWVADMNTRNEGAE